MPSKAPSTTALISGFPVSVGESRKMPDASANSENTPTVASTARNARMYSALLPPTSTMPAAAATSAAATTSTRTTLPLRLVVELRSTAGRVPAVRNSSAEYFSVVDATPLEALPSLEALPFGEPPFEVLAFDTAPPAADPAATVMDFGSPAWSIMACPVMPRLQCSVPPNRAGDLARTYTIG